MNMTIKQGDTFPPVEATVLKPDGTPLFLPLGTAVRFHMGKNLRAGATLVGVGSVVDAANGRVAYQWVAGDTDRVGGFLAEFQLTLPDGRVLTVPNDNWIELEIVPQIG